MRAEMSTLHCNCIVIWNELQCNVLIWAGNLRQNVNKWCHQESIYINEQKITHKTVSRQLKQTKPRAWLSSIYTSCKAIFPWRIPSLKMKMDISLPRKFPVPPGTAQAASRSSYHQSTVSPHQSAWISEFFVYIVFRHYG